MSLQSKQTSQNRSILLSTVTTFIVCCLLCETTYGHTIALPASRLRYEEDTYTVVVQGLKQGDRDRVVRRITYDPLVARHVLIRLLEEPGKNELARPFAELFRVATNSELESPFVEFFAHADPQTRERLLRWAGIETDAEWFLSSNDYPDRFSTETENQAYDDLKAATREFHEMGFVDGEAFCLRIWFGSFRAGPRIGSPPTEARRIEAEQIGGVEGVIRLFRQTGNLRGETNCLVTLAGLSFGRDDAKKTTELLNRALEGAIADKNLVLQFTLRRGRRLYDVDEKVRREAVVSLRMEVKGEPGLKELYYRLLLIEPVNLEEYRELLTAEKDPILAIRAHRALSDYLDRSDNLRQSIEELDRAIELARSLPYDMGAYGGYPHPAVAWMLWQRAMKNRALGKLREAEIDCHQSLRELEPQKSAGHYVQSLMALVWYELGYTYRGLGEYPLAIQAAQDSLALAVSIEAPLWIQSAHQVMAEVYSDLGDLHSAEEHLQEAMRQPHEIFNASPLQMAELHLNFQLYEDALRDLDSVEPAIKAYLESRPQQRLRWMWVAKKYELLTHLYLRLGEPEKALESAQEVERHVNKGPEGLLGIVLAEMKRYAAAEGYFLNRLKSIEGKDVLAKQVDAHKNLGRIYRAQRKPALALEHLNRALELYRKLGDRRGEIEVLLELARVDVARHDPAMARGHFSTALQLSEDAQDQQGVWSAHYGLAQLASAESQPREAAEHLRSAVDAVEKISGRLNVDLYKSAFVENKVVIYDELIRLVGTSSPAEAFQYAERRQARAFLESLQRGGATSRAASDELDKQRKEVEGRLIGKQKALITQLSKPDSQRDHSLIDSVRRELSDIRSQHTQLLKTVELRHPVEAALQGGVTPLTARQVQTDILGPDQVLVEFLVTDQEVLAFVLDRSFCKFVRLPISRKELNAHIRKLHLPFQQLREGRTDLLHLAYDVSLSHELYKSLFLPLEPLFQGKTDLILVPDEVLNYLPFESLARSAATGEKAPSTAYAEYRDVDWLVRHYTMRYAISATSLDPKLRRPGTPQNQLVAFGLSGLNGSQNTNIARTVLRRASENGAQLPSLPPLPQAARESRNVARIMAGKVTTRVFTNDLATENTFYKEAPTASYLHLAVHSLLNNEQPNYSALLLASEPESDGLLQTFEISNTHLNANLVTLSGCETALGKLVKGEGLLGLRRAFLQAGARSVLVSLWSVEDSTADFMEEFYRNLGKDLSPGKALRLAKTQYLERTLPAGPGQQISLSHPFFWAPFVLTTTSLARQ